MKIEQIYTACLAEAAYYIESEGEAAIIDPLRESGPYLQRASKNGARIKYVFETHFHADFVSGHCELAAKTGAAIVYGPGAEPGFQAYIAKDEEEFWIGKIKIRTLHTPGHTLESTTWLLIDEQGNNHAIFTGDTLLIGDVGRPDLAVKSNLTAQDLASLLYDSIYNKILPLEDNLIVYPGHGPGSACGKHMSKETTDTLGHQKQYNYALQSSNRQAFISSVLTGLTQPPKYFPINVALNKAGAPDLDSILAQGRRALDPFSFAGMARKAGALILDVRSPQEFTWGFVPGAINIGLDGQFAPWAGALFPELSRPIVLVAPEGREEEAMLRLARIGYDKCIGYLDGSMSAWNAATLPTDSIDSIQARDFARMYMGDAGLHILDVRRQGEYNDGHLIGAMNLPLDYLAETWPGLDPNKHYYIHCAGGYRSVIAASFLKSKGIHKVTDIAGGYQALKKLNLLPVTMKAV